MPVPTNITDLSTTASSNSPAGSDSIGTSLDDYLRAGFAFIRQLYNTGVTFSATVGGTANAITLTPSPAPTAYSTGQSFVFTPTSSNTAATTVNVSTLGAKTIKKYLSTSKVDVVANDLVAGFPATIVYDGTDFVLVDNPPNSRGADVASAATVNLDTATGDLVDITGTTTITAITLADGKERTVRFAGILTLTNGASLILPSGANIVTAAGDFAVFRGYASGVVRCTSYVRATGLSVDGIGAGSATIASASTVDLGSTPETSITISGTTTITSFGSSMKVGQTKIATFSGILTLTHNATSLILPSGANITTAAGDVALVQCISAGNYRVMYFRASGAAIVGSSYKVGTFTRDTSLASGSQSVTGVGFKPSSVLILANQSSTKEMSIGIADASTQASLYQTSTAGTFSTNTNIVADDEVSGSASYVGNLTSLDTDGFTVSWTKTGAPTGTLTMYYLAMR